MQFIEKFTLQNRMMMAAVSEVVAEVKAVSCCAACCLVFTPYTLGVVILTNSYRSRVCARTQRNGAAARESFWRDRPAGLTSLAFHTCGSANPFRARFVLVLKNQ